MHSVGKGICTLRPSARRLERLRAAAGARPVRGGGGCCVSGGGCSASRWRLPLTEPGADVAAGAVVPRYEGGAEDAGLVAVQPEAQVAVTDDGYPVVLHHVLEVAVHRLDVVAPTEHFLVAGRALGEQAQHTAARLVAVVGRVRVADVHHDATYDCPVAAYILRSKRTTWSLCSCD